MEWLTFSVVCLFVCVLKCSAKSLNDLQEFSEFLTKTSQLDQILKKGNDFESDEDEVVSDHAWEESGKFEGDLILNDKQRRLLIEDVAEGLSRNGLKDSTKRWPGNEVVYYIQKEHFSGDQIQAIEDGIDDLTRAASCLKFRPYKKGDRDAVVIQGSRRGCFSQVGYQGGYQVLNLSGRHPVGRGCFRHGTVVHEFLHTLGFYHMQSSPDRDDFIDVRWENIVQPARHNFRKYNSFSVSDFGVGYDYDSVLHYSRKAFSSNGGDTLVPKQGGASIGQRVGLSDKDTEKLNKMYCDADSNNYEAGEELKPQKPITRKKQPNKPFEGHGIGYHQGKTVVIKLPAAETFKLSEYPSSQVFNYFSKTTKALPPTFAQGFRTGEKVGYSYRPPVAINREEFLLTATTETPKQSTKASGKPINTSTQEILDEQDDTVYKKDESGFSYKEDKDLNDAFDRLGNIIKNHVYPSQKPDFRIYKLTDYNEFFKPIKPLRTDSIIKQLDKKFSSPIASPETASKIGDFSDLEIKNGKYIKNSYSPNKTLHESTDNDEKISYDPAFGKISHGLNPEKGDIYSFAKVQAPTDILFETPTYATRQHLQDKDNFTSLYYPKTYHESKDKVEKIKSNHDSGELSHPFTESNVYLGSPIAKSKTASKIEDYSDSYAKFVKNNYSPDKTLDESKDKVEKIISNPDSGELSHPFKESAVYFSSPLISPETTSKIEDYSDSDAKFIKSSYSPNKTLHESTDNDEKVSHDPASDEISHAVKEGDVYLSSPKASPKTAGKIDDYSDSYAKFIESNYTPNKTLQESTDNEEKVSHDPPSDEVSHDFKEDVYSFAKVQAPTNIPFETPTYATREHLHDKDNFTSLYYPHAGENLSSHKHTLFGYVVPVSVQLDKGYYKLYDNFKKLQDQDASKESYTLNMSKGTESDRDETVYGPVVSDKQAYSIFGVLVPLSRRFFNDDKYLKEKSETYEDNR